MEALEKWEATRGDLYIGGSHDVKPTSTCQFTLQNHDYSPGCWVDNDFLIGISYLDKSAYAYIDLRTFQPGGVTDPWTTITNDSWRGKTCRFVFSVEQDLVLAVL